MGQCWKMLRITCSCSWIVLFSLHHWECISIYRPLSLMIPKFYINMWLITSDHLNVLYAHFIGLYDLEWLECDPVSASFGPRFRACKVTPQIVVGLKIKSIIISYYLIGAASYFDFKWWVCNKTTFNKVEIFYPNLPVNI